MMQRLCRFLDGLTGQDGQDIDIGRHLLSVARGPFWRPWSQTCYCVLRTD